MDSGKRKPRWTLLPFESLEQVVKVMQNGLKSHPANDWRSDNCKSEDLMDAAYRHVAQYQMSDMDPASKDPDSGFHPLAHAICNLLFVLQKDLDKLKE